MLHLKSTARKGIRFAGKTMFKFTNYDAVGLDFDNTLIQYNLCHLFHYHFTYLTNFLKSTKGYDGLSTEMNKHDIDFIRRGLFMDFERGNILDISADGLILSASHGTKKLTMGEVSSIYGKSMKWSVTDLFIEDKLALWEGPASHQSRTLLDYSDTTATLVFAKVIDLLDNNDVKSYGKVWPDLLDAIIDMYSIDSDLTRELLSNTSHYVHKTEPQLVNFLEKLSERCKLLIITGSSLSLVGKMAEYSLGTGWERIFSTIICNAKKPKFFTGSTPFLNESGTIIKLNSTKGHYQKGNWLELYEVLKKELSKAPKCVYFGDSTIQDIYATSIASKPLDSVAVIEETLADGTFLPYHHQHADYLKSIFWGPYLGKNNDSVMAHIIKNSKLCVPSLLYFANKPIDHEYIPFWN